MPMSQSQHIHAVSYLFSTHIDYLKIITMGCDEPHNCKFMLKLLLRHCDKYLDISETETIT